MSFSKQLDQLVAIQAPVPGKDSAGGNVVNWIPFGDGEYWAGFRNLSGAEKRTTSHGGQVPVARTEITMWFDPGITEEMRIVHRGKYYQIRHVNNFNERDEILILTCDTGTAVAG